MFLCSNECIPCCDFCAYAISCEFECELSDGSKEMVTTGPIGCSKHDESEYQVKAQNGYYCEDFYCKNKGRKILGGI